MRVEERVSNSDLPYYTKHPALLPSKHNITASIIREHHVKNLHAGTQATFYSVRKCYWIVNGRSIICCRAKPKILSYVMGNLPKDRLVFDRPFLRSGVDYCGPFYIKEKHFRNRNKIKIYTAIFVCFTTKALHIELVSDLISEAFLAALRQFFARRGKSSDLYSDNATNFQGAKREIDDICTLLKSQSHNEKIAKSLANENTTWHFIPSSSPHFGGLWESAVKSLKHHITRVIGDTLLAFENLLTYVAEIEAVLNSRPLTPLSLLIPMT